MKTHIQKWGNSLALRIPKSFADEAGLHKETTVEISLSEGTLVITPITDTKISLEELLSKITPENLHNEINSGTARGNEAW